MPEVVEDDEPSGNRHERRRRLELERQGLVDDPWVAYSDLEQLGFVNPATGKAYSRKHLLNLMRRDEWPKATQVSANRVAWRLSQLRDREAKLPVARSLREPVDAA
jgi:hypothetical protein